MAHKRKKEEKNTKPPYTVDDAMKVTDDIFKLSKEKNYHPGAFIHGMIFALEYTQLSYKIPPKQIADLKRDCRKYLNEIAARSQG